MDDGLRARRQSGLVDDAGGFDGAAAGQFNLVGHAFGFRFVAATRLRG